MEHSTHDYFSTENILYGLSTQKWQPRIALLAYDSNTPVSPNIPDPSTPFSPFPFNISKNSQLTFHFKSPHRFCFQFQFNFDFDRFHQNPTKISYQMASETEVSLSSLIERLMSMTLPFISGETAGSESDRGHDSDHRDPSRDRIILINPLTQSMTVIGGSSIGFDSLLNELTRKNGQPPASQASIDAMPSVEVTGTDEIESLGGECVICLEEWGVGDVAKEMPCKHRFHGGCVEKWLKIHGSCPVCRYKMPVDDLSKKIGDENGGRRREIWVTFSVGGGRSSEEERTSQESSNDS